MTKKDDAKRMLVAEFDELGVKQEDYEVDLFCMDGLCLPTRYEWANGVLTLIDEDSGECQRFGWPDSTPDMFSAMLYAYADMMLIGWMDNARGYGAQMRPFSAHRTGAHTENKVAVRTFMGATIATYEFPYDVYEASQKYYGLVSVMQQAWDAGWRS